MCEKYRIRVSFPGNMRGGQQYHLALSAVNSNKPGYCRHGDGVGFLSYPEENLSAPDRFTLLGFVYSKFKYLQIDINLLDDRQYLPDLCSVLQLILQRKTKRHPDQIEVKDEDIFSRVLPGVASVGDWQTNAWLQIAGINADSREGVWAGLSDTRLGVLLNLCGMGLPE